MKVWLRWIKIWLTCGLGFHATIKEIEFPGDVLYSECTRCHHALYTRPGMTKDVHLRPKYWEVARGLYDRGIQ